MRRFPAGALLLLPALAGAQDQPVQPPFPRDMQIVSMPPASPPAVLPDVPGREGAWVLQVTTTGGIMGNGARSANFTVISDGRLTCDASDCGQRIAPAGLSRLAGMLAALDVGVWPIPSSVEPVSFCRDCLRTRMTLRRREGDTLVTYSASWDPTQPIAAPLRELAGVVRQLAASPR